MKNDDVALVIFQAKAAISKACEGRACLPECLRAIERSAFVETAPAPLREKGAKAAKRTPAESARPHGARLRVPVGGVRTAWRAFASCLRGARGRFRRFWSAIRARLPAGARHVKIAVAAAAVTLGCTISPLHAEVECVWMGNGYSCSGSGDTIHVIGGLPGGEGGGGSVVTNMIGTCTNCVAMSPQYVRDLKDSAIADLDECDRQNYVIGYESGSLPGYARAYTNTCELSPYVGSPSADYLGASNFLFRVGALPWSASPVNKAASVTRDNYQWSAAQNQALRYRVSVNMYDGAATAYNDCANFAQSVIYKANEIYNASTNLQVRLDSLRSTVNQLSDEQCTAQWDGGTGLPGDGGSGGSVITNQTSGNWCTYDQGEALKELLGDIKRWNEKQISYLASCSNYLGSIDVTIHDALFSRYTHIPSAEFLGSDWKTVYLDGEPLSWGYEPTNILQRIELLLYGISGVGTNSVNVADETGIDPSDVDDAGEDEQAALEGLQLDGSSVVNDFRTISDALGRFYNRFSSLAGTQFSGQQVSASYTVEIGEQRYDVPAFSLDAEHSRIANTAQLMCRSFLLILYLLAAGYAGFRFYAVFLAFVVKYAKWAQELLSSLFAD